MKNRPSWMAPLNNYPKTGGRPENLKPGFTAAKCEGVARSTGCKCQNIAVTLSRFCWQHGGAKGLERKAQQLSKRGRVALKPGTIRRRYEAAVMRCENVEA